MSIVLVILICIVVNLLMAYVPVMWVVGYSLRRQECEAYKDRLKKYVEDDEISTEKFIELTEADWDTKTHAPLRKDT